MTAASRRKKWFRRHKENEKADHIFVFKKEDKKVLVKAKDINEAREIFLRDHGYTAELGDENV